MPLRDIEDFRRWIAPESTSEVRPVRIWYRDFYATDVIDVVAVTNR